MQTRRIQTSSQLDRAETRDNMVAFNPVHHLECELAHLQIRTTKPDANGTFGQVPDITDLLVYHFDLPISGISPQHILPFTADRVMSRVYLVGTGPDSWVYVFPYQFEDQQRIKIIRVEHEAGLLDYPLDGPDNNVSVEDQLKAVVDEIFGSVTYDSERPSRIYGIPPEILEIPPSLNSMLKGLEKRLLSTDLLIFQEGDLVCSHA